MGIPSLWMFTALFFCGCGASGPTITARPISESEYRRRARGIIVEILGETGRATVSAEVIQRSVEQKIKANPAWLQNPKEAQSYAWAMKSLAVTNFYQFPFGSFSGFVTESPASMNAVSNQIALLNGSFLRLHDAYVGHGLDDEWKTDVMQRARSVYSALSNVVSSLTTLSNFPGVSVGFPSGCFRTSYPSPYQRKNLGITSSGPAPDERMRVEHVLRFDWLTGVFHQRVSTDLEERVGNFERIGPYVMAPLPTLRTNHPTRDKVVFTNYAVVVFLGRTNSVLKCVFSDLNYLKDSEFKLGDCNLDAKP